MYDTTPYVQTEVIIMIEVNIGNISVRMRVPGHGIKKATRRNVTARRVKRMKP